MGKQAKDLVGLKFGNLQVIHRVESKGKHHRWLCDCDCGTKTIAYGHALLSGRTVSCGCYKASVTANRNKQNKKHGDSQSRLYRVWRGMIDRCENPNRPNYKDYGERGIGVCAEWHEYSAFKRWAEANGYNPNAKYGDCTLDRIDVNGNYEPQNCRFANAKQQAQNRRNSRCLNPKTI